MKIPLSSPDITDAERSAVLAVLSGPDLSLGPQVQAFEAAVTRCTKARFAVAVNSGTSGLHLCVKAAGIADGDEVITTPFSFVASANCVLFERGIPVFVDIDPTTWNIDPDAIASAVTPRTRALLPVHVFGRPCRMDRILDIARRYGLAVIEDACEAIGAVFKDKAVGTFGQSGVFACYPNKQITTGEGGVIVTDDEEIARMCRSGRNQGRGEDGTWLLHETIGYNYRLSDINSALGVVQLGRLPEILAARARVAALYSEMLRDCSQLVLPAAAEEDAAMSWFVYVVRLEDEFGAQHRDLVLEQLRARGIGCSNYFAPIHLQPFYRARFGYRRGSFPCAERISERTIALPFFNRLTAQDVEFVCANLREIVSSLRPSNLVALGATARHPRPAPPKVRPDRIPA